YSVVHSFNNFDLAKPNGVIEGSDGAFYGTDQEGSGLGRLFRINTAGNFTVLHGFDAYTDGYLPLGKLLASGGYLYGTTAYGGVGAPGGNGIVYKTDYLGNYLILHRFTEVQPSGIGGPASGLIDAGGYLYGTSTHGGNEAPPLSGGAGFVYR